MNGPTIFHRYCGLLLGIMAMAHSGMAAQPAVHRLSEMASGMKWIGVAVTDPDHYLWCTSPILGPDKKIHLFCSRWPKVHGMDGWRTHSEIVHYIGDKPEGPFAFQSVAIPANPGAPWNNTIHNPAIAQVGDRFVLLYISFDWRKDNPAGKGDAPMFTGMALSESINGPWRLLSTDGPIVPPSEDPGHWTADTWALDNPTFLSHGGKYYIYFKGGKKQRESRYGYAVADHIEGPWKLSGDCCTDNTDYIEDATAFVWKNRICLLTNDNFGSHTGIPGGGILWYSDTPTRFSLVDAEIGFLKTTDYVAGMDLGKATKLYGSEFKFERPGILMLGGQPAYFYGPSGFNLSGGDTTESYVMKINLAGP